MTDFAHIKFIDDDPVTQSIQEHCDGTAAIASFMAKAFEASPWAQLCGKWHDIGKYSDKFQRHIIAASGLDTSVSDPGLTDHATAGALLAKEKLGGMCLPIAYCICGHHHGLMDFDNGSRSCLKFHLSPQENPLLDNVRQYIDTTTPLPQLPPPNFDNDSLKPKSWHLWIRMLFSCLVDADWLDTERFMNPANYKARANYSSLAELKAKLDDRLRSLSEISPKTDVNIIRGKVQDVCRHSGSTVGQGIYSLTVPTGGGKTLSSLLWAMEHAIRHNLKRIIFAIPYTSIVTQTVDTLRDIFGYANVVEHHSYADISGLPAKDQLPLRLATENWDAPIIVTTNVQLFESLYSNKTSRCRKLHNIARSVLILDEVQMLPAENLHPIIDILDGLSKFMHTSILLTTATQPAFSGTIGSGDAKFEGLHTKEIIPDTADLFKSMRRVKIEFEKEPMTYEDISEELYKNRQILCVANTRNDARQIYDGLQDKSNAFHLSRMMCQQHIADKLSTIKQHLAEDEPVIVVSTQLIEAGVDIDFPTVWRAVAGLDSIIQSAGRCNREGRRELGLVHVFQLSDSSPRGILAKGISATLDLIDSGETDFLSPDASKHYFQLFYSKLNDTDVGGLTDFLYRPYPQFESAAGAFKMIDDNSLTVYVPYSDGEALLAELRNGECSSSLLRKLQRYSVNIPKSKRDELEKLGAIKLADNVYMLPDCSNYDDNTGLTFDNKWLDEDLII